MNKQLLAIGIVIAIGITAALWNSGRTGGSASPTLSGAFCVYIRAIDEDMAQVNARLKAASNPLPARQDYVRAAAAMETLAMRAGNVVATNGGERYAKERYRDGVVAYKRVLDLWVIGNGPSSASYKAENEMLEALKRGRAAASECFR